MYFLSLYSKNKPLESEGNQEKEDDKFNRLDIKVKNQHDEIILIEIQYSSELDYLQRILYASSKAIVEHMKESDAYSKVSKVISISILYFDFGDGDDYIQGCYKLHRLTQ